MSSIANPRRNAHKRVPPALDAALLASCRDGCTEAIMIATASRSKNVWFERAEIVRIGRGLGQWRLPLAAVESRRGAAKDTFLTKTQQFRSPLS
jgi:hypothetical protein